MTKEEVLDLIKKAKYKHHPNVFLFDKNTKDDYNESINLLKNDYKFIDINEYVQINLGDYGLKANEVGFADETNSITINDLFIPDIEKRRLILRYKLNKLKDIIDDKTILNVCYNNLYLKDEMFYNGNNNALYEDIRYWLKNGYVFDNAFDERPLIALVYCETKEKIMDFCRYGFR